MCSRRGIVQRRQDWVFPPPQGGASRHIPAPRSRGWGGWGVPTRANRLRALECKKWGAGVLSWSPGLAGESEVSLGRLGGVGPVPSWGEGALPWGGVRTGEVSRCICPAVHPRGRAPRAWDSGVSPVGQLHQRDGGVGTAHAGGAAPATGTGRSGNAGGGGGAAALTRAAMLQKDVGAQLASSPAGVEQRGAALRVAGRHVGSILKARKRPRDRHVPRGPQPCVVFPDFQAPL